MGEPGAPIDTSSMGADKSIVIGGVLFDSSVIVEISNDNGASFHPIVAFTAPGKKVIPVAAQLMRAIGPASARVDVGANNNGALFTTLPLPAGNGPGVPVNVAAFGSFTTFTIGGQFEGSSIAVEVSEDGVNYFTCAMFAGQGGDQSKVVVADFMRTFVRGRSGLPFMATVGVGAEIDATPGVDEKVKASATDTTPGFLDQKLVQGSGVSLVLLNPGADEDIRISVSGADAGNITTGDPITVRGPTNAEGVGAPIARADHEHRLELEVEDEGALAGARPAINFVGAGVGAVDNPIEDRVDVTIPGAVTDGASVVRSVYSGTTVSSSLGIYVDAMSGLSVAVPIDGFYWGIFESDSSNQNANGSLEFGISVNSVLVALVDSERMSNGNANDERTVVTTVYLGALVAGDLVRALFRKASGAGSVSLYRKNLTIFKVQ